MDGLCIVKSKAGERLCPRWHANKSDIRLFPKSREAW